MGFNYRHILDWGIGKKTSLRYKVVKSAFNIFLIFVIVLLTFIFLLKSISYPIGEIMSQVAMSLFVSFSTFLCIVISLKYILDKHFFTRLNELEDEMKIIREGNTHLRLSTRGFDELDELVYFTNTVLDNFEEKIEFEKKYSLMDPLTLCYNRRALSLAFDKFVSRHKRGEKIKIGCMYFDLDNFKKLNDTYGHNIGDEVLKELTKVVRKSLRTEDVLYRIGGEEFIVLFFNIPKKKVKEIILRLQKQISYDIKKALPKITQKVTISGGFVSSKDFDLSSKESLDKMLAGADALLYEAKASGKDKVIFG